MVNFHGFWKKSLAVNQFIFTLALSAFSPQFERLIKNHNRLVSRSLMNLCLARSQSLVEKLICVWEQLRSVLKMTLTKSATILLIVGLVVGVCVGYVVGFTVYQPQITSLQSQVTDLESQIASLQSQVTDLQSELMPGRLPIYSVGDQWVFKMVSEGTEYTWTEKIIGEEALSVSCYVMETSSEPAFMEMTSMKMWLNKATLDERKVEYTGEYEGTPYTYVEEYSNTYEGGTMFPLIVGREATVTQTTTSYVIIDTETYPEDTEESVWTMTVEKIEEVTVTGGTFDCFKVLIYVEGSLANTMWFSDTAKTQVKYIDHLTGDTMELLSYSV